MLALVIVVPVVERKGFRGGAVAALDVGYPPNHLDTGVRFPVGPPDGHLVCRVGLRNPVRAAVTVAGQMFPVGLTGPEFQQGVPFGAGPAEMRLGQVAAKGGVVRVDMVPDLLFGAATIYAGRDSGQGGGLDRLCGLAVRCEDQGGQNSDREQGRE